MTGAASNACGVSGTDESTGLQDPGDRTDTDAASEVRELRAMVRALREELERTGFEKQEAVEAAVRGATDEIAQLRASAQALREALEDQAADHTQRLADAERAFRDERVQLTGMIAALREQLEGSDGG